jgi:hypothetical protein
VLERNLLPLVVYRNSLATPYHVRILFSEYGGRQEACAIHSVRPIGFAVPEQCDNFRPVAGAFHQGRAFFVVSCRALIETSAERS